MEDLGTIKTFPIGSTGVGEKVETATCKCYNSVRSEVKLSLLFVRFFPCAACIFPFPCLLAFPNPDLLLCPHHYAGPANLEAWPRR